MKRAGRLRAKTPMRRRSPKRAAYMASDARAEAVQHMLAVKGLPCCACGAPPPSAAHHVKCDKKPRNDLRVIPLCWACHQGPHGYHAEKRTWVARHGPDYSHLRAVIDLLGTGEE